MRFSDDKYVQDYLVHGKFPKIHDDIFSMSRYVQAECVIDLGACTGLLSARLAGVYNKVIAIEPNENYISRGVTKDNILNVNMGIKTDEDLKELGELCRQNHVQCVFARRVIPEIWDAGDVELVQKLAKTLATENVDYIVLEGRKSSVNCKNHLHSIAQEVRMFEKYYTVVEAYNNCRILKLKG